LHLLSFPKAKAKSSDKNLQMNKELIIRSSSDFVDFALLKDGKLIELHKEEKSNFQVIFLS
jgi:ribonuclease G